MSARTGIPLPKKVPRSSQARSATLIDKHSTEHNSRIFEVRNNPIVLTAFGLRESDSIIVESVVRVGGIDYFQPYLKDGIDIRLYSGRTSAVLAVAGRYRVVLSGDLGEVVCTYTIQQADLGRDVGMPSGAQANRPNLFLGDPGDGSLSNIIEVQDRPWTFFAYNLGEADAIQVLQVFGEGPNYREEVYSPESGEGALHLTVARNSITLDRSGRFRFRLQGTTPGVVLVGNPTTPQVTASTSSSGGGGGTVTRVDVSAGEGLVASGSPITTVGTIQIELSDGTKASLERADTAVQSEALASVATSGDYEDLSNLPTIPEQVNLIAGDNVEITGTYPNLTIDAEGGDAGGQVDTVAAGMGIDVDSTDPTNPEVSINTAVQVSLDRADSAVQPDSLATVATSGSYDDLGDLPVIPEQVNLTAGDNITLTGDYPNIEIAAQTESGGGQVDSVVAGTGISVDAADPENPEVALSPASVDSLNKADTAVQPDALGGYAELSADNEFTGVNSFAENINVKNTLGVGTTSIGSNTWASIHSANTSLPIVVHDSPSYTASSASLLMGGGAGFSANATTGGLTFAAMAGNATFQVSGLLYLYSTGGDIVQRASVSRPHQDGATSLGTASSRWIEVFAVDGTINTSDARDKTTPRLLTNKEIEAAANISRLPSIFQWLHAIEEKGADARLHCGPTVQAVMDCMESCGLAPHRYGFVCYDEWEYEPAVVDEWTGEELEPELLAGNRYSLRPTELAMFLVQGITHRLDAIEARLPPVDPEED